MEVTLIVQSIDQADLIIEHFEVMVFKIVLFIENFDKPHALEHGLL
jgi:hypothetical protein